MNNSSTNHNKCILIGNSFANIMQLIVAVVAVTFLFLHKIFIENMYINYIINKAKINYKFRYTNRNYITYNNYTSLNNTNYNQYQKNISNSRNWKVWFLDNLKQGASTSMSHIWGTYAAIKLSGKLSGDECGWFFLQFTIDTILGVLLAIIFSKLSVLVIKKINFLFSLRWLSIGNYDNVEKKYKYYVWLFQLFHWLICSLIARIICTLILVSLKNPGVHFVNIFSNGWENNRHNELIFVILLIPLTLNTFQFIIQNIFLRWKKPLLNNSEFLLNNGNNNY